MADSPRVILAIETSQREGGVALRSGTGQVEVELLRGERRHDDDLMAAIDRVVRRGGLRPEDLEAVGVSVGPGGFTGLRIAVSTAKMMAEVLGCALVAVPGALVAAESRGRQEPADHGPLLVALAAKRDTFWATRVRRADGCWTIAATPGLARPPDLDLDGLTGAIADRYLPDWARRALQAAGLPVHEPSFDPRSTLAVVEAMLTEDRTTDPLELGPLYPRPPEAVSIWQRRHGG
ncbi:MAG: tRNA (adenosine(37)-N6)-threonylcarbamoyltransferase complex dimerization subunit type 1 TsaB [Planctomycetota bacterium]